ncbi:MICOS subunit MIC26 [Spathaspora sp. JA1]|nr:MICOS subunit MIC26 [Spathaspora sp. JA1]
MFGRAFRFGIPVLSTGAIIATNSDSVILNETSSNRRNFYEDESNVVNIPGTVTAAPASEIQALGTNRIIDGISVRSTSTTEHVFKSVREFTESCTDGVQLWLNTSYSKYNATERKVTDTVSGLHNKSEDLLPNSIYVVIAFLTGTIAARPRGIVARVTFPVIFGVGAFKYFLPRTFDNSLQFLWQVEQNKIPALAKQQEKTYNSAVGLVHSIEETAENSKKSIEQRANSLKKSIADITGLNIDEEVSKK